MYQIAHGFGSLFRKPTMFTMLQGSRSYWRAVLGHCVDGGLQSVLNEYAHVLVESEGLQSEPGAAVRARKLAAAMTDALTINTASNRVTEVGVVDRRLTMTTEHTISSHFAARFGHTTTSEQTDKREGDVRWALNSPFRPFVLVSISVGQGA